MEEETMTSERNVLPSTISCEDGKESMVLNDPLVNGARRELVVRYRAILSETRLDWTVHHCLLRRMGSGGLGVVFLGERQGADGFRLPVALKVFTPERYGDDSTYDEVMARMARVAVRVAQIQQDNLIDVQNFVAIRGIRVMEMEWVDGYDLQQLMTQRMLDRARLRVDDQRWAYLNDVIVTAGPAQPRLKPGIAIAVLRDCLAALASLHRDGIVHGDIKPSNIMLKRTGNAKLIDIGAAFELSNPPPHPTCTLSYAAPEILAGADGSPRSDLASLGYVLVEMLSGTPAFSGLTAIDDLSHAKRTIVDRLPQVLPEEVTRNDLLMNLVTRLIAPDPAQRFPDAQSADLVEQGAANFQRQLIKGNLASEYDNEIRVWLEELDQEVISERTEETTRAFSPAERLAPVKSMQS
jgi:serine/threonine protein kinase